MHAAAQALKEQHIQGVVTAPIHKKNVQSASFNYTGHTPFFKDAAGAKDVLMLLYAEKRIAQMRNSINERASKSRQSYWIKT